MTLVPMSLDDYQSKAALTAVYPGQGSYLGLMYVAGKLNGEAGEVAEYVFKGLRDDGIVKTLTLDADVEDLPGENGYMVYRPGAVTVNVTIGPINHERRMKIKKELGDTLWYVAMTAKELGFTLSEIAGANIDKLAGRHERGTLQGSGDER